jgi:hypothetical protein
MKKEASLNYRFAIGSLKGLRSSSYSIFTNQNKSDIYISHRGLSKDIKASLHESGQNYIGYTTNTQHPTAIARSKESRHFQKWTGYPIHPNGLKYHFQIVFPTEELRLLPCNVNNKAINWIEPAPKYHQLIVTIITGSPDCTNSYPKPCNVVYSMLITDHLLINGTKLWIIGIIDLYDSTPFRKLKNDRAQNIDERIIGMLPIRAFRNLFGNTRINVIR